MTSLEDAWNTLRVFQATVNFYQEKYTDKNSKIDRNLYGEKEDWKVSKFFPDLSTKTDISLDIDSKEYFACLTDRILDFEKYGLKTVQHGGIIYFESSEVIIDKVSKLLSVIAKKDKLGGLFYPSDVSLYAGRLAIDRKIIFKYGVSLIDVSLFKDVHIVAKLQDKIKAEIKNENGSVPDIMICENIKCRGKWNDDVLALFIGPEKADLAENIKIPVKDGVHVITTGNISNPYEVHDNDCSGQLNKSEIDGMKTSSSRPCCKKCTSSFKNMARLREDSRNERSDLQLIQSDNSHEYLMREKLVTMKDINNLTRSAMKILCFNLTRQYQLDNEAARLFNASMKNSNAKSECTTISNMVMDDDDDDEDFDNADNENKNEKKNKINNDISNGDIKINNDSILEEKVIEDDLFKSTNIKYESVSYFPSDFNWEPPMTPIIQTNKAEEEIEVMISPSLNDEDVEFIIELCSNQENWHPSSKTHNKGSNVEKKAPDWLVAYDTQRDNDISIPIIDTKVQPIPLATPYQESSTLSPYCKTRSDHKKHAKTALLDKDDYLNSLNEIFEMTKATAKEIREFIAVHGDKNDILQVDTIKGLNLMADFLIRKSQQVQGKEANSPISNDTILSNAGLRIKIGLSSYQEFLIDFPLASAKTTGKVSNFYHPVSDVPHEALRQFSVIRNTIMNHIEEQGGTIHEILSQLDVKLDIDDTKITAEVKLNPLTNVLSGFTTVKNFNSNLKSASAKTDQQKIKNEVADTYACISMAYVQNTKLLYQLLIGSYTNTTTACSVMQQTDLAIIVATFTGCIVIGLALDGAAQNQKFQNLKCTEHQFYGTDDFRLPTDIQRPGRMKHPFYEWVYIFFLPDASHWAKNWRNNIWYSRILGTKFLLLPTALLSSVNNSNSTSCNTDNAYDGCVDNTENRVNLACLIHEEFKLDYIDWEICFEGPFKDFQAQMGFRSLDPGLTMAIFDAVKNNGSKMNVGFAYKFVSQKMWNLLRQYIEYILSQKRPLSKEEEVMIRGIESLRPYADCVNRVLDVFDGVDVEGSKNCLGKEKRRQRIDSTHVDKLLLLRSLPRMLDDAARAVDNAMNQQRLKRNNDNDNDNMQPPNKKRKANKDIKISENLSMYKNFITPQTCNMIANSCYAAAGLVEWYGIFRPDVSMDMKMLNSDKIEGRFGVIKGFCKGETTPDRVDNCEARTSAFKIMNANKFIANGYRYYSIKKRTRLSAELINLKGKGNCELDKDEGENVHVLKINRTHAVKPCDMNNLIVSNSHNNVAMYKNVDLFKK